HRLNPGSCARPLPARPSWAWWPLPRCRPRGAPARSAGCRCGCRACRWWRWRPWHWPTCANAHANPRPGPRQPRAGAPGRPRRDAAERVGRRLSAAARRPEPPTSGTPPRAAAVLAFQVCHLTGAARMSPMSRFCLASAIAVGVAGCTAQSQDGGADVAADPYQWLEDVTGEEALAWVREQNAAAEAELADTDAFRELEAELLAIYDSDERIPAVSKMGDYYYNFWRDKNNERGIWRRTTLEEYRKDNPEWELLLDLDALNAAEGENWVWHGANCLRPEY